MFLKIKGSAVNSSHLRSYCVKLNLFCCQGSELNHPPGNQTWTKEKVWWIKTLMFFSPSQRKSSKMFYLNTTTKWRKATNCNVNDSASNAAVLMMTRIHGIFTILQTAFVQILAFLVCILGARDSGLNSNLKFRL